MADRIKASERRLFAEEIAKKLPAVLDSLGYVHGEISVLETPAGRPALKITMPGALRTGTSGTDNDLGICVDVTTAWDDYRAWKDNVPDADEKADDVMAELARRAAKAYADRSMLALKSAIEYDALRAGLSDAEYIKSNAYPELVSKSAANDPFTDSSPWLSVGSGMDGLDIAFVTASPASNLKNPSGTLCARLRKSAVPSGINADKDFLGACMTNLNKKILNWLKIESLDCWVSWEKLPDGRDGLSVDVRPRAPFHMELPLYTAALAADRMADASGASPCVAQISDVCLGPGAILLSRTAMLAIAKKSGAKKRLVAIPVGTATLMAAAADPDKISDGDFDKMKSGIEKEISKCVSGCDTIMPATGIRAFGYDVMTGALS